MFDMLEIGWETGRLEIERILRCLKSKGVEARIMGSGGVGYCVGPAFRKRITMKDIDCLVREQSLASAVEALEEIGYREDLYVRLTAGRERRAVVDAGRSVDLFGDRFRMAHTIPLRSAFDFDYEHLPCHLLVLTVLQYPELWRNRKQAFHGASLAGSWKSGAALWPDPRLAPPWREDWGLWFTIQQNLRWLSRCDSCSWLREMLSSVGGTEVCDRVATFARDYYRLMEQWPKSMGWKLRNAVGPRWRWRAVVE